MIAGYTPGKTATIATTVYQLWRTNEDVYKRQIHGTEPKEGKIELVADCDGLLKIDRAALLAVNRTPQMTVSYTHLRAFSGGYPLIVSV